MRNDENSQPCPFPFLPLSSPTPAELGTLHMCALRIPRVPHTHVLSGRCLFLGLAPRMMSSFRVVCLSSLCPSTCYIARHIVGAQKFELVYAPLHAL